MTLRHLEVQVSQVREAGRDLILIAKDSFTQFTNYQYQRQLTISHCPFIFVSHIRFCHWLHRWSILCVTSTILNMGIAITVITASPYLFG